MVSHLVSERVKSSIDCGPDGGDLVGLVGRDGLEKDQAILKPRVLIHRLDGDAVGDLEFELVVFELLIHR
jgi:hypothetical protein